MRHDRAQLRDESRDTSAQLQKLANSARESHARTEERTQAAIDCNVALEKKIMQVRKRQLQPFCRGCRGRVDPIFMTKTAA
jgi:hypothetical protein